MVSNQPLLLETLPWLGLPDSVHFWLRLPLLLLLLTLAALSSSNSFILGLLRLCCPLWSYFSLTPALLPEWSQLLPWLSVPPLCSWLPHFCFQFRTLLQPLHSGASRTHHPKSDHSPPLTKSLPPLCSLLHLKHRHSPHRRSGQKPSRHFDLSIFFTPFPTQSTSKTSGPPLRYTEARPLMHPYYQLPHPSCHHCSPVRDSLVFLPLFFLNPKHLFSRHEPERSFQNTKWITSLSS